MGERRDVRESSSRCRGSSGTLGARALGNGLMGAECTVLDGARLMNPESRPSRRDEPSRLLMLARVDLPLVALRNYRSHGTLS